MKKFRLISLVATILGLNFVTNGQARADRVYDAVNDFSLASNPNVPWSYGSLTAIGGTFSAFSTPGLAPGQAEIWTNNLPPPNSMSVTKNISGAPLAYNTEVLPPNLLNLDGESGIADVRFTVPQAGIYDLSGLFQRVDYVGNPVSVRVAIDGITVFSMDNFTAYDVPENFSFSNLILLQATVIDFAEGAPQYQADSTGLSATITYKGTVVPEPASMAMCIEASLAGLCVVAFYRRSRL